MMVKRKQQEQEQYRTTDQSGSSLSQILKSSNKHNILEQLSRRITDSNTPDFIKLKQTRDYHPVFVYGTLRQGGRLHSYLEGCPYLGKAWTMIPRFDMRNAPGGSFPVVFDVGLGEGKGGSHFSAKISGEVYAVPVKVLLDLDDIESNGNMYNRKECWVSLRDQTVKKTSSTLHPNLKTFIYIGNDDYWKKGNSETLFRCSYTLGSDNKRIFCDWEQKKEREPTSYQEYLNQKYGGVTYLDDEIPFNMVG